MPIQHLAVDNHHKYAGLPKHLGQVSWLAGVKCNSLRDRTAIQMSYIHELALLSVEQFSMEYLQLQAGWIALEGGGPPQRAASCELWQVHKQRECRANAQKCEEGRKQVNP